MKVRDQGVALLVASTLMLQGCADERTTAQCMTIDDYAARLSCLDDVMFPDVARGAAIGAVAGAVLGGAVAFAITRRPSIGTIGKGVLIGGMVGGVAGGAVAYLRYLQARTSGNRTQMAAYQNADIRDEGRQFRAVERTSTEMRADFERQFAAIGDRLRSIQSSTDPALSQLKNQMQSIGDKVVTLGNMIVKSQETLQVHSQVGQKTGSSSAPGNAQNADTLRQIQQNYERMKDSLIELDRERAAKAGGISFNLPKYLPM